MPEKTVFVVSRNTLQNELFVSFLKTATGFNISASAKLNEISLNGEKITANPLILFDCLGLEKDELWTKLSLNSDSLPPHSLIALFNVEHDPTFEKNAINHGIRGIFYVKEPLEIFSKGIDSIFQGEMWYSRKIVSQCLLESRSSYRAQINSATPLTSREKEILVEIASGASNQEIADNLFVSLHTIKTHIYNIYKKIHVSNRLQATLWAAKNI
jgi:LuxR family transcriptional regulator, positive regulator of biofilm formation